MKRILCISGSRADYGLLEWSVKVLSEAFEVSFISINAKDSADAFTKANVLLGETKPDCLLILGDRWEILQAAIAAHLQRVPIAHLCGGDTTEGSYDNQMRDCISVLAKWHFVTSKESADRIACGHSWEGYNVHMVGNIALDYIMHGDWKRERPYDDPYVVVSYQAETIDADFGAGQGIGRIFAELPSDKSRVFIRPNADRGSDLVDDVINGYEMSRDVVLESLQRGEFLNLLFHADEFIGNSSAILYEAPALGVKCRLIGRRQEGRVAPSGDGRASERIKEILCRVL